MGATIIEQNSKYRCEDYEGTDTGEVIVSLDSGSTKTYPLTCYSHTEVTQPELRNLTRKYSLKPSTNLDSKTYGEKFTRCDGHRAVRNPAESEPDVTAEVGQVSQAEQINTVRYAIQTEITDRKKHVMYRSIVDAENSVYAHDIEFKAYIDKLQSEITNADKEGRGFPNKQINFRRYVSASDLNTLKDITIQVMRDCICYSDCNSYAVCWCHGYCNYY